MGFIVYIRNKSWLVKGFLFLSLFCFGAISLLSVYEALKRKSPNVAFIYGEPIDQFNYASMLNLYSMAGYNSEQAHKETWRLFVSHKGLKKLAEEEGIILSEEEVNLTIPPSVEYTPNKDLQKRAHMMAEVELYSKKLENLFTNSNLDITQELGTQKPIDVEFKYLLIPSKYREVKKAVANAPLSTEAIEEYWKAHEATFEREAGVKVDIVKVKISPSDEDMDNWKRKIANVANDWQEKNDEEEVLNFINRYQLEDPQAMIWYSQKLLPWQKEALKLLVKRGIYKRFIKENEQDICILYKLLKRVNSNSTRGAGHEIVKIIIPLEVSMKTKDIIKGELHKLAKNSKDLASWEANTKEAGMAKDEDVYKREITKNLANRIIGNNSFEEQLRKKIFLKEKIPHFKAIEPFQHDNFYAVVFVRDFSKKKNSSLIGNEEFIEKKFHIEQLMGKKARRIQKTLDRNKSFSFIRKRFSDLSKSEVKTKKMSTNSYTMDNDWEHFYLNNALPTIANSQRGEIGVLSYEGMTIVYQVKSKRYAILKEDNTSSREYEQVFSETIFDGKKVIDNRCFYF